MRSSLDEIAGGLARALSDRTIDATPATARRAIRLRPRLERQLDGNSIRSLPTIHQCAAQLTLSAR